jgi:hypothetical protein
MRGAGVITLQVLAFAVGLAVICGLIGFLVVHFAGSGDAATGFGWGMLLGGAIVGYAAAAAAPGVHPGRGRRVLGDRYLGQTIAVPESSLQQVFAASLTFAASIALIVLS